MNRKVIGCVFCVIAALLYVTRFIAAAIYMSNVASQSRELFQNSMNYVGKDLHLWALAALIIGIVYIVSGEWNDLKKKR